MSYMPAGRADADCSPALPLPVAPLVGSLFLTSSSLFIYQVTLTRLLSPILLYHFVFLLTSVAIFGLGMGGYWVYRWLRRHTLNHLSSLLPGWLLVLSASFLLSFSLIYKLPFLRFYLLYSVIASLPFLTGGVFISLLFTAASKQSHRLYFADLAGAGFGGIAAVFMLNRLGVVNTVLLVAVLAAAASVLLAAGLQDRRQLALSAGVAALLALLGVFQPGLSQFERRFTAYFTSPLTSLQRLRQANAAHRLEDWVWDAFSRTDIIATDASPRAKILSIDGGSNSEMIQFDGNLEKVAYLRKELNYLPFKIGENRSVLLIGPGGGKDIVLSLLAGSGEIHAVEINSGTIAAVRKYSTYNGGIYDRGEVLLHIQDGRNFVQQSRKAYDLVYLAQVMTEVAEMTGYALAENFIYTKEAIKDYWRVLSEEGKLAFVLHDEPDLARLLRTVAEALEEEGLPEPQLRSRLLVASSGHGGSGERNHLPLLLVKKTPFSAEEKEKVRSSISSGMHRLLYLAGDQNEEFWQRYSPASLSGVRLPTGARLNFYPTTDNRPYFFDFRAGIDPGLLLLLVGVFFGVILIFWPAFRKKELKRPPFYFIGLGLGFMLIEIPLIQRFSLLLGHPIRSFIVTLIALLAGGGLGSLAGQWRSFCFRRRYLPLFLVAVLSAAVYGLLATSSRWALPSLNSRILLAFALLFPLGFFMGMPFPFGLRALQRREKEQAVPLMWGINGTMSIGGSVLSVLISMKLGFSYSLALGGLIYMVLFWIMPFQAKEAG